MDFTISSASLANVMQAVAGRLPNTPATAMHGGVLVAATGGEVTFRTTDMSTSTKATVQALVEEPGETVVSAKMMQSIAKSLPDAPVNISALGDAAQVTCLKSKWRLRTLDPRDFPSWEEFEPEGTVTIQRRVLADLVDRESRAIAKDETKPVLRAIRAIAGDGTLRLIATDSYRVFDMRTQADGGPLVANIPCAALKGAMSAKSSAETVAIGCSGNQACIEDGVFTYVTRLIEGNYPNIDMVMPKSFASDISFDPSEFSDALKRAGVVASVNPSVTLFVEGDTMTIRAASADQGESTETIHVDMEGDPLTVSLNYRHILDCVDHNDAEMFLHANGTMSPVVFNSYGDVDMTYLLMPVRA